jgi:hypothetical protein
MLLARQDPKTSGMGPAWFWRTLDPLGCSDHVALVGEIQHIPGLTTFGLEMCQSWVELLVGH